MSAQALHPITVYCRTDLSAPEMSRWVQDNHTADSELTHHN